MNEKSSGLEKRDHVWVLRNHDWNSDMAVVEREDAGRDTGLSCCCSPVIAVGLSPFGSFVVAFPISLLQAWVPWWVAIDARLALGGRRVWDDNGRIELRC